MRRNLFFGALALIVVMSGILPAVASAQQAAPGFTEGLLKGFNARSLGPYRAGSWVTSFAVPDAPARDHLYTLYVGTRNGGVWKTTNNGTTFEPVFDAQPKLSIGDVAVAPSDPNIVWVGTGEPYCARSSNSGDGVWKSADAGKTWTNMGLGDTHHIARVVIHPADPDVVYVAAMGHLFSENAERGVFKTMDGGKSWKKVLYIDDRIGAVDLALVKSAPDTLYAATYEKVRRPWTYSLGGPGSAIYKTTDGGRTWTRLAGGLPTGRIGRIGLDVFQKDPDVLYAVVENVQPEAGDGPGDRAGQAPRRRAGAAHGRQRGLPHGRRRQVLAQGQRRVRGRTRQGPLLLQPAPHRSGRQRRPSTSPGNRSPRRTTAARPGKGWAGLRTASCPRPSATGGRCGSTRSTRTG